MMRAALSVAALLQAAPAVALDDVPGWAETRWGMTAAEIEAALGARAAPLPGRWVYGGAHAELSVAEATARARPENPMP